jgi:hypothetical protein
MAIVALAVAQTTSSLPTDSGILGHVVDESGATVVGAKVLLLDGSNREIERAITDSYGTFRVVTLPSGLYMLRIEEPGFHVFSKAIRLDAAIATKLRFELKIMPGSLPFGPTGHIGWNPEFELQHRSQLTLNAELPPR